MPLPAEMNVPAGTNGAAAPAAPAQAAAATEPGAPMRLDPNAMIEVRQADGKTISVPASAIMARFTTASALEQRMQQVTRDEGAHRQALEVGRRFLSLARSNPEAAADETRRILEQVTGKRTETPSLNEAELDPAQKVLLQMLRTQQTTLDHLLSERTSEKARDTVGAALDSIPSFRDIPAERQLAEIVTLALRSNDPNANVDDVALHVHGLINEAHQARLERSRQVREEQARNPAVVSTGSGTPGLTTMPDFTVKDMKQGKVRAAIDGVIGKMRSAARP